MQPTSCPLHEHPTTRLVHVHPEVQRSIMAASPLYTSRRVKMRAGGIVSAECCLRLIRFCFSRYASLLNQHHSNPPICRSPCEGTQQARERRKQAAADEK